VCAIRYTFTDRALRLSPLALATLPAIDRCKPDFGPR
jgi:hypothetical protein